MRKLSLTERIKGKIETLRGLFKTRETTPYVITVSNSSTETVKDFDLFGAYEYLNNKKELWKDGSLTINSVTISSGISHISYQQFLAQSMHQPFEVGLTHMQSISGSTAQLVQKIIVDTQDANGNRMFLPIIPLISPFQSRSDVINIENQFMVDGGTKLTISNVYPSAVFNIAFFLNRKVSARGFKLVKECAGLLWLAIKYAVSKKNR